MTPLLTAREVATMLGVSVAWVHQHSNGTRRPQLRSIKMGKSVRFRMRDVEDFVNTSERAA